MAMAAKPTNTKTRMTPGGSISGFEEESCGKKALKRRAPGVDIYSVRYFFRALHVYTNLILAALHAGRLIFPLHFPTVSSDSATKCRPNTTLSVRDDTHEVNVSFGTPSHSLDPIYGSHGPRRRCAVHGCFPASSIPWCTGFVNGDRSHPHSFALPKRKKLEISAVSAAFRTSPQ